MDALISGCAGRALLIDGNSLRSFDADDPLELVPRKLADFAYLFGEMLDLRVLENTDIESVRQELKHDSDSALALELALISLDAELPNDIRYEALGGLDELLADDRLVEHLEKILYARPLPDDSDLGGALQLCKTASSSLISKLLGILQVRQSFISEVREAWDTIPTKVFGDYDLQAEFQSTAVREGLFRALVINRAIDSSTSTFLLNAGLNPAIKRLRNHRQVLQHWTTSFRRFVEPPSIKNETAEEILTEVSPKRRHGRRFGIDRKAVLREVNKRKAFIIGALHRREVQRIPQMVDDLVDFHRANSEPEYAAKSLCDLAMEAKAAGIFSLQLELTERSVNIAPDDGWSWAQHGDAFLNMGQLDNALRAYEQADAFAAGLVAKTGRAQVLKAKGFLDDALVAYEAAIALHPEDVFAKTGRAEVLKAKGLLDDALIAYDEVIALYPENVFAKTGRAEVLKAKGLLDDALAAYEDVIALHSENAVAKNGRAEVLKAKGLLDDALVAYEEVIALYPEDVFAKTGRAEVLKAKGLLDDALAAYEDVIALHPENAVAKNGRAEVLKAKGLLDDALAAYEDVIALHPENAVAKNGRAEVLKAKGLLDDALVAFEATIALYPEDVFAKTGRAEVLKATGRMDDALAAYDEVIALHPENVVAKNGRAEVLNAKGLLDDALAAYEDVIALHPENAVAKNGRAEVLNAKGLLDDALVAFEATIALYPEDVFAKTGRAEVLKATGRMDDALAAYDEVIALHPENVVAKTGRAEVFKAKGLLDHALAAYDEVIALHPEDAIARNGRACILAASGLFEEALAFLPEGRPVSLQDWIGSHIRAMILLKVARKTEAIQILNEGLQKCPWSVQKEYFRVAVGVAWLQRGEFKNAQKYLAEVKLPQLQPTANVLRLHLFGFEGNLRSANMAYESLVATPLHSSELTQELRRRFLLHEPPQHDDEWISEQEVNLFLLAA